MAKSKIQKDFAFKSNLRGMAYGGEVSNPRAPYARGGVVSVNEGYADGGLLSGYAENKAIPEVQQAMGLRKTLKEREQLLDNPEQQPNATRVPPRPLPGVPMLHNADFEALGKNAAGTAKPTFFGAFRDRYGMGPSGYADGGLMTDIFTKRTKALDNPEQQEAPKPAPAAPAPAPLPGVPTLTNQELSSLGKNAAGTAQPTFFGALRDRWGGNSGYAGGGKIKGPGGPTDDKIPAMLSDGEYVLPAKTVKKVGVDKLDKLVMKTNHKAPVHLQRKPGLRRYAEGGVADELIGRAKDAAFRMAGPFGALGRAGEAAYKGYQLRQPVAVPPALPKVEVAKTPELVTKKADTSGDVEGAIERQFDVAVGRAKAPIAPAMTPQNLSRYNSFQKVNNPLAGVHGSTFWGSLLQGAINRGNETAKAYNNRTELANAQAQSQAINADNTAANTRYGHQMQGHAQEVQQRGQDITSALRSKELGMQDRYQQGQLANLRAQRALDAIKYGREQQEKAQTELEARATQQASVLDSDGKVVTNPETARRFGDYARSSFPAVTSSVVDPNTRAQARTNAGANFELAQQGTQNNVNWIGRAAQAVGTLANRPTYPQAVQVPMANAPSGPATWAEKIMNTHIPFFGATNVVRNEQGVPFNVGANTDLNRAKDRAALGYAHGGLVKKRGLRRG